MVLMKLNMPIRNVNEYSPLLIVDTSKGKNWYNSCLHKLEIEVFESAKF